MSRSRTLVLLAGALLLLWLKPWRRLAARTETPQRPQWFGETPRAAGTATHHTNLSTTQQGAGFASGLATITPPAPPAQPAAPPVEAALDALATPAPGPAGAGPLPFEVLDDMQGQHSADAETSETAATAASDAGDVAPAPASIGSNAGNDEPAAAPLATEAQPDDLIIIEGIGPRARVVMEGAGITSFAQLADTPVETLRQILRNNGIEVLNPQTWPDQARLAADGRMEELRELQGRIKNGKLEG